MPLVLEALSTAEEEDDGGDDAEDKDDDIDRGLFHAVIVVLCNREDAR